LEEQVGEGQPAEARVAVWQPPVKTRGNRH
jgi:hypothetical protein